MSRALPTSIDERVEALSDVLEQVLATWEGRRFPEGPALVALRRACQALSSFRDRGLSADDPLGPVDAALRLVAESRASAPPWADPELPTLDEVRVELVSLREAGLDRLGVTPELPAREATAGSLFGFEASRGQPALRHDVAMPPLSLIREERDVAYELAHVLERDDEDDEAAEKAGGAAPAAAQAAAPSLSPEGERCLDQLRFVARDLMEDVAILYGLRKPLDIETWVGPERFEVRLLAQLDALFALARATHEGEPALPLAEELFKYATEWTVPDPGRAFALALPLACIAGEASARFLLVAMRHTHERTLPAFVDALVLGTNPALPRAIGARLGASEAARVQIALLHAARRRRDVSAALVVMALSHPDPAVVVAGVSALAACDPEVAQPLLSDCLSAGPDVAVAAAVALAGLGAESGIASLRGWLEEDVARASEAEPVALPRALAALRALACLGDRADEPLVLRAALRLEGGLSWLGVFGEPAHVAALLRFQNDSARMHAARRGLRILVGGDFESDEPEFSRDPTLREQVLRAREERLELARAARSRLRGGAPHQGARTLLDRLADPATRADEREDLCFELGMITKRPVPLDPGDWIARQRAVLAMVE